MMQGFALNRADEFEVLSLQIGCLQGPVTATGREMLSFLQNLAKPTSDIPYLLAPSPDIFSLIGIATYSAGFVRVALV